jgi:putative redox protein
LAITRFGIEGTSGPLESYVASPRKAMHFEPLLMLCHGLPLNRDGGRTASLQLPELSERLAAESGWAVAVTSLRGVGGSPGTFSASGWKEDLSTVVTTLGEGRSSIVLAGFGFGGSLALRMAAEDERIRGVAALATPAHLDAWCGEAERMTAACHLAGVVGAEPLLEPELLVADVLALDPLEAAALVPPKRMMVVHGSSDPIVPVSAARELVDAAQGHAELRVIQGAGHWLRADPRMFATLLGWLDRLR